MRFALETEAIAGPPIRVRLRRDPKGWIRLEAQVETYKWLSICGLTPDGMLALWDLDSPELAELGFDMQGDRGRLHHHGGFISLRIA